MGWSAAQIIVGALGLCQLALTVLLLVRHARAHRGLRTMAELEAQIALLVQHVRDGLSRSQLQAQQESQASRAALGQQVQDASGATLQALALMGTQQQEQLGRVVGQVGALQRAADEQARAARVELTGALERVGARLLEASERSGAQQRAASAQVVEAIRVVAADNERRGETLKQAVEQRLDALRTENAGKLEQMRQTVDEKLQGTLEQRLGASFTLVNQNLERVFKSVGEMQSIATGVGDLKRVLSNVKTRGTWGETALGALLEQTLTCEQFGQNVEVLPGTGQRVDYALKLPQDGSTPLWLPIDAKLPTEDYERLAEASERGDAAAAEEASRAVERVVRLAAKDIARKYVGPPHTTDFAVMFLPTEGLFAEVVRRPGLVDALQRDHRVVVTGPTTLGALLNSLRMGFRTLAIQRRSSEVWEVLGAVKTEFDKFGGVLDKVSKKLDEASNVVRDAGTRRRAVDRKLRDVEAVPAEVAERILGPGDGLVLESDS